MSLKNQLSHKILAEGTITIADYMELCITHYYATRDPFGVSGDFTTSPEISQVFGELIGAWLYDRWQHISASHSSLCECGPGRGTLMKDILRVTRNTGLHESIDIALVETSPKLLEIQERALKLSHTRIQWHKTIDTLPKLPLFLIANEFFDALPIHQYVNDEERKIGIREESLAFQPEGAVTQEISPTSITIMEKIALHIKTYGGAALIIDYGYANAAHVNTLQAVRAHQYVPVLADPGEADITAHVDFSALMEAAEKTGAYAWGVTGQGEFLQAIGAQKRTNDLCRNASPQQKEKILSGVERLLSPQQMGRLFKVMAVTSDAEKPPGF